MLAVWGEAGSGLSVAGCRVAALDYGLPEGLSQGCWCREVQTGGPFHACLPLSWAYFPEGSGGPRNKDAMV